MFHHEKQRELLDCEQRSSNVHRIYRNYLYLDADEVISAAAVLDDGQVVDELRVITRNWGADVGVKLGLASQGVSLAGSGGRRLEQHLTVRRTVHMYVERLLEALRGEQIKVIEKPAEVDAALENFVIECDVDLVPPVSRSEMRSSTSKLPTVFRSWVGRLLQQDPVEPWIHQRESVLGDRFCLEVSMLSRTDEPGPEDKRRLLLVLDTKWVTAHDVADLSRRATVVGQVIAVARDGESLRLSPPGGDKLFFFDTESACEEAPGEASHRSDESAADDKAGGDPSRARTAATDRFVIAGSPAPPPGADPGAKTDITSNEVHSGAPEPDARVVVKPLVIFK